MYADKPVVERLAIANKICNADQTPLLEFSFRDLKKIEQYASHIEPDKIFPFGRHLSDSINKAEFIHSFLVQPKVWIRVRNEFKSKVEEELKEKEIYFETDREVENAWSLKNSTALDQLETFKKGYFEIQDLSSQKTIQTIRPNKGETWWDACAGSGGKSLMMAAYEPGISLVCSDSRDTILKNLAERFQRNGFKNYESLVLDLTSGKKVSMAKQFDGIVADVPCTGSGTWSRTPEWLTFFNTRSIEKFQGIQRNIISVLSKLISDNKPLIYITCSVFKEENEDNTAWVTSNLPLQLQTQLYIEGSSKCADNMFVARFIKS